jgi:hypothetical protein
VACTLLIFISRVFLGHRKTDGQRDRQSPHSSWLTCWTGVACFFAFRLFRARDYYTRGFCWVVSGPSCIAMAHLQRERGLRTVGRLLLSLWRFFALVTSFMLSRPGTSCRANFLLLLARDLLSSAFGRGKRAMRSQCSLLRCVDWCCERLHTYCACRWCRRSRQNVL